MRFALQPDFEGMDIVCPEVEDKYIINLGKKFVRVYVVDEATGFDLTENGEIMQELKYKPVLSQPVEGEFVIYMQNTEDPYTPVFAKYLMQSIKGYIHLSYSINDIFNFDLDKNGKLQEQ